MTGNDDHPTFHLRSFLGVAIAESFLLTRFSTLLRFGLLLQTIEGSDVHSGRMDLGHVDAFSLKDLLSCATGIFIVDAGDRQDLPASNDRSKRGSMSNVERPFSHLSNVI